MMTGVLLSAFQGGGCFYKLCGVMVVGGGGFFHKLCGVVVVIEQYFPLGLPGDSLNKQTNLWRWIDGSVG